LGGIGHNGARGPVQYDPQRNVYDVFSYRHVKETLQDSAAFARKPLSRSHSDAQMAFEYLDNAMVWSDGPKHTDAKAKLFQYFRPDMLAELETAIRDITRDQLSVATVDGTEFDFVSDFCCASPPSGRHGRRRYSPGGSPAVVLVA
jgi:Cytochrome P450